MRSPVAPGIGVATLVESALAALSGERLRYIGRATDLVWVGIGRDVDAPTRAGMPRVLAEHGLHLQCPWRFSSLGVPLLGSWDVYRALGSDEWAEGELLPGAAAFDPAAAQLTDELEQQDHRVEVIVGNDWGGFSVEFSGGLLLEALPVTTASEECWRYLMPAQDTEHFVVFQSPK